MAAGISECLCCIVLSVCFLVCACEVQENITAKPGETVKLPCQVPSNTHVIVIEWTRPDLGTEYVLFYRDGRPEPENQYPSFKNRVDLVDSQMKDGDVSLMLKGVTKDDSGRYECHVIQKGTDRRKRASFDTEPIKIINLDVRTPGLTNAGSKDGNAGLVVGVSVLAVVVVISIAVGVFVVLRKRRSSEKKSNQTTADNAVELQLIQSV